MTRCDGRTRNARPCALSISRYCWLLAALTLATACLPKQATRTTRPTPDLHPWVEQTVRSTDSGSTYSVMRLQGPADAPVLLLLHGGIFDNRLFYYMHTLSRRFTVVAPQYPDNSLFYTGHVADWGKVVTDFLKAADLQPDYVAAVSNGAYGAIEYLLQNPDHRVKQLFLISTVMFGISEEEVRKRTRFAKLALSFAPGRLQGVVEKRALKTDYGDAPGKFSQPDFFFVRPYPYYYQVFRVPITQGRKKQDTMRIDIPVTVLHGTDDDVMAIRAAALTPRVFPHAEFIEMKGLGHDMVFSDADAVVAVIFDRQKP